MYTRVCMARRLARDFTSGHMELLTATTIDMCITCHILARMCEYPTLTRDDSDRTSTSEEEETHCHRQPTSAATVIEEFTTYPSSHPSQQLLEARINKSSNDRRTLMV